MQHREPYQSTSKAAGAARGSRREGLSATPRRAKPHRSGPAGGASSPRRQVDRAWSHRGRPTIQYLLGLLEKSEFLQDAYAALEELMTEEIWTGPDATQRTIRILQPFLQKWKALPPFNFLGLDPKHRNVLTVLSGHWGVIPVFPWTTDRDIRAAAGQIRKAIGKVHQDSQNTRRAALADWLELHGFSRSEIAQAVWGRTRGLRRLSSARAIRQIPEAREQELLKKFMADGLPYLQAGRKVMRTARRSEAPAGATVRMAVHRRRKQLDASRQAMNSPKKCEPLAYTVTLLLRSDFLERDDNKASPLAAAFWDALGIGETLFLKP